MALKGKNISTRTGKGRVRVPQAQLTGAQRARMTRLGEIFYMDKTEKAKAKDDRIHSGVRRDTSSPFTDQKTKRRFTLKRTYGKPEAGTGRVIVSKVLLAAGSKRM